MEICVARTCFVFFRISLRKFFLSLLLRGEGLRSSVCAAMIFPFLYGDLASFLTRNFMMLSWLGLWRLQRLLLSEQYVNRVLLSYRGEKVRNGVVQSSFGRRRRRSRRRRGASEAAWR